jgi:hypothetical protein
MRFFLNFTPTHVYVTIRKNAVWVKQLETQTIVNLIAPEPFTTTRLLVGQSTVAATVIMSAILQSYSNRKLLRAPKVIIHPLEYIEDGLSEVEERTFLDLLTSRGITNVIVWVGAELTDLQVTEKFIELRKS